MKTLIIYHSIQGNTEYVVREILNTLDADVVKINSGQKNINTTFLATHRVLSQLIRPKQFNSCLMGEDIADYDRIILASPCWFYDITPPMKNFVENMYVPNVEIFFIITHGGDIGELRSRYINIKNANYIDMIDFCNAKKISVDEINHKVFTMLNK